MEASALRYQAGIGLHGRSPLLRLQSDERLIAILRRGNVAAFDVLVSRYESRLLAFCRHLLGSREDAEDVLQEVMTAAFNAIVADERPINVKPWLYRIARNRSLNHLRRTQAIAVDTMDQQLAEHGASTADKVAGREEFRMLVGDIQQLPESQRTALVLREMDALSYEQIAEAMETTVSSVKSLLVRARVSLAEASEARLLSCDEVRIQLGEVAEGLAKRPSPLVRRHLKGCTRCTAFQKQLKATNKALAALLPVGPFVVLHKLAFLHLGHSAGASAGSTAGATAAGSTAAGGAGGLALGASGVLGGGSLASAGMSAVATKAAAGLAAAVIVTAGAVEVDHQATAHHPAPPIASVPQSTPSPIAPVQSYSERPSTVAAAQDRRHHRVTVHHVTATSATATTTVATTTVATAPITTTPVTTATTPTTTTAPGRVRTETDPTTVPTTTPAPAPPIATPTTPVTSPVTEPTTVTTPTTTATTPTTPTTVTTVTTPTTVTTITTTTDPTTTTSTDPTTVTTTTTVATTTTPTAP